MAKEERDSTISNLLKLPLNDRRAFNLLWSLPRHEVIEATKRIASMMQKDILGCLPIELSSLIISYLDVEDVLSCALVSKDWNRIFNNQGIWASRCLTHKPPIRPAKVSWDDIKIHRQLMLTNHSSAIPEDLNPEFIDDDLDDRDMPGLHPQSSLSAVTALRGGFAGVRQSVWERTGLGSLPIFSSSPVKQPPDPIIMEKEEPPISSYLYSTDTIPQVNYKHLYLSHRIIANRIRKEEVRPLIVDAISSIESGGLSGHTEAIYSLSLFRHPLTFKLDSPEPMYSLLQESERQQTEVTGRDWLLTGSRDKTLRLWALDTPKPKVVRVYMGGHEGSILSTFVVKLQTNLSTSITNSQGDGAKVIAISGGSDGKICRWDIQGDGKAEKEVMAHTSSVLCVKGDQERIVSCSKDRTIKVLDINTLEILLTIGDGEPERHRGAINEVALSKDYIISASGDRSIRLWDIKTGSHLFTLDSAHPRGIASLDFLPSTGDILGTIATGSSDATVRLCHLVPTSDALTNELDKLSLTEPESESETRDTSREVTIEEGPVCWTDCVCPPAIRRVNSTQCMRCWNRGHTALVRTLCLNGDNLISGGYDGTVKIWDKTTGKLLNDLTGARTGRVFAVTADSTRVISTGLDCRINIWNFAHGLDTSFVEP